LVYFGQGGAGVADGGDVAADEASYANNISQMLMTLQNQKMKVDQDLTNEMMRHLVKMRARQQ